MSPSAPRSCCLGAILGALLLAQAALPSCAWAQAPKPAPAATGAPAAPDWDKLRAAYDYRATVPDPDYRLEHIALLDAEGKAVPGLFLRPRAPGVYPVVLLLHGLTSDKETMIQAFGRPLAARGFACLALDAREHGERKSPGTTWSIGELLASGVTPAPGGENSGGENSAGNPSMGVRFAGVMKGTVGDYRRAIDYLESRRDVDASRIGLLGYSMGAMMGAILGGVDERVKAVVLEVGGDPIRPLAEGLPGPLREQVESISPSSYVGHIAPRPLLLINARDDQIMPQAAARRLQQAAREPAQIVWAPGGHILSASDAGRGILWLAQKLAPNPATNAAPNPATKPATSPTQPQK